MNEKLIKNNYVIIPNFISTERAKQLAEEYKKYSEENNIDGDAQALNSHSSENYISFLELLCEKTPEVSSILEETVLPTYAYSRVYKNGSILEKHKDRDACEISFTLHLDGDKPWPIWIETPEGEKRYVSLNSGDAMMYLGCTAEHWRDAYEGTWYAQVFLHYVQSRGSRSYAYFDKVRDNRVNESIVTNNQPKSEVKVSEEKIEETTTSSTPIVYSSTATLDSFIKVYNNIVPEDLCDDLLKEYVDSDDWSPTRLSGGRVDDQVRSCNVIALSHQFIIQKNPEIRSNIDKKLFESASLAMKSYHNDFNNFAIEIDTGYELLRYQEGQFYLQHTDSFKEQQRSVSCSFQLNDDYEGGEFAFFDREVMIRAPKGSAIMFPSNFMYPHEIMPVTKGTRYSIITWFV
jgi:hypothetical protein